MAKEFDAIADLAKRVAELESLLSSEKLKAQSQADPLSNLSQFDRLQTALEQQQQAFQEFVRAHTVQKSNNIDQYIPLAPEIPAPVIKQSPKDSLHAATQTPLAQVPSVPPPPPPPVRVRPLDPTPKGPSPLRRSSSAEVGRLQWSAGIKDEPVKQHSSARLNPSSTPSSSRKPQQKTPSSAKSNRGKDGQNIEPTSAPTSDVGLRERRAAFAALQSFAPQNKASKRTSLAITAAQRELLRATARAKEESDREREENDGVLAWIGFVLLIIGGIGATILGIMAMMMKTDSVPESARVT